jgi:ArsR family transcriptional regulator
VQRPGKNAATALADERFQSIGRALADPRRFAIFQQIAENRMLSCGELHEQRLISPATISHHLKELSEAGLIDVEREGRAAKLSFKPAVWNAYLKRLRSIGGSRAAKKSKH